MRNIHIYVAGPVPRGESDYPYHLALKFFYRQLEAEAKLANVTIQIPYHENELDRLASREFASEIRRRIKDADAMLVVIFRPDSYAAPQSQYSVACEAQIGAEAGKPIAIVAHRPEEVPRLIRVLGGESEIYALEKADFQTLFQELCRLCQDSYQK